MLFNISLGFLDISNASPLNFAPKLTNVSKMAIFSKIHVDQRDSCDTYGGLWGDA